MGTPRSTSGGGNFAGTLLRCASAYSFSTGLLSVRELCARAVRADIVHLGLCDWGGIYGVPDFALEAERCGLHAIFGAELGVGAARVLLLARDATGFRSLCRLVSDWRASECEGFEALAQLVAAEQEGLFVLCEQLGFLGVLREVLDPERLRVALPPLGSENEQRSERHSGRPTRPESDDEPSQRKVPDPFPWPQRRALLEQARAWGLRVVAAPPVYYGSAADRDAHRLAVASKKGLLFDRVRDDELAPPGSHVLSKDELAAGYADVPEALVEAEEVARACTFSLREPRPLVLPHTTGAEHGDARRDFEILRARAEAGLQRRYGQDRAAAAQRHYERARERLAHELGVVDELGFSGYFLVVEEIASLAKSEGIPCLGRGSAADSLIAHCLGFTDADPLRYGLCFERFLNVERFRRGGEALPDIDLDFCWRRRDELLERVVERFGEGRVALLCTHPTLGFRAAYREAARALGIPVDEVDRRARGIPRMLPPEVLERGRLGEPAALPQLLQRFPEFTGRLRRLAGGEEERLRETRIWWGAFALAGLQRGLGLHPGGTVLSPVPLRDLAPLERSAKGLPALQWDKHVAPHMGLVKIDLLGNRGLSTFVDARREIVRLGGDPRDIDAELLGPTPEEDDKVAAMLRRGKTIGVWQIESPGMRRLLTRMDATTLEDTIQSVALIRPGPAGSGMMHAYIRRKRGDEALPELPSPLDSLLGQAQGVMLYQEDLIHVLAELCGLELPAADLLRRAIGGGSCYHYNRHEAEAKPVDAKDFFFERATACGIPVRIAQDFWAQIERFSRFSFNKAHSVTYGRLAWRLARIKARCPAAVLAAILANDTGYYEKRVYVEEAKRCGVTVLAPCIHRSGIVFRAERIGAGRDAIRAGFRDVRELPADFVDVFLRERDERGPYFSVEEFTHRVEERGMTIAERWVEHLILVGAFDLLEGTRPEKLWRYRIHAGRKRRIGPGEYAARRRPGAALFADALLEREPILPCLPDFDARERARLEQELLGFTTGLHVLDMDDLPDDFEAQDCVPLVDLPARVGQDVRILGFLAAQRRTRTKNGRLMCFLTLEDRDGIAEVVLFPDVYERFGHELAGQDRYVVRGRVVQEDGALTVTAASVTRVE